MEDKEKKQFEKKLNKMFEDQTFSNLMRYFRSPSERWSC